MTGKDSAVSRSVRLNKVDHIANNCKEARKQVVEPALDNEMDVGDSVAGVQRLEGERTTVTDKAAALEMLENAGADPADVVRINPRQFINAVDGAGVDSSEVIAREEYTFYRRDD